MNTNQQAALVLTIGTVGTFVTMGLHPTGADTLSDAAGGGANLLARGVHALAIAMLPLMLTGSLLLTLRLRSQFALAVMAYVSYALAVVAVLVAAAASGLLAPSIADRMAMSEAVARESLLQQFRFSGLINQAFSKIYVSLSSLAIVCWSIAMQSTPSFSRSLGALGVVVGLLGIAGIFSGQLHLGIHGFGLVVIAQGVWTLWTAWSLRVGPE
jgi:hypothetical protein